MRPVQILTAVLVAGLAACSATESNVNQLRPDLAVAPSSIDFGDVVVLYQSTQTLQLVNAGLAPLEVSSIEIEGNEDNVFSVASEPFELARDDSTALDVVFAPATYDDYARDLVIYSNDGTNPELHVPLAGSGVKGPTPDISVDTTAIDFGTVDVGTEVTQWFTITNLGDGELDIESTEQTGSGAFTIINDPEGQTLASTGDAVTVLVSYAPTQDGGDSGWFTIDSNDPDEPEIQIVLLGNGGGDFDYPIASIDCPDSVDPPTTVSLDGSGSYDPNGYTPLVYEWSLDEAPEGSAATIADAGAEITTMQADLAGDYTVSLKVQNAIGVESAPAKCSFTATPQDQLHVELTWNTGNSDLDLHLIQSGYDFYETPGDCCWCNPNPSWGDAGTDDDPNLSIDNRAGYGPENINLNSPTDGDYYIQVHYFEDNGGGTTTATVKVWVDGLQVGRYTQVLTHNQVWDVGYVKWPDGVVVEDAADPSTASARNCW